VRHNDESTVDALLALAPERIVISPGPGTPDRAGVSMALIRAAAGRVPVLGVCLGHQAIGEVYGGSVVRARQLMHGKVSAIHHRGESLFQGLTQPFTATRYHSLVVERATLPDCLDITAWTETESGEMDEIMGLQHRSLAVAGVQFHPESILTQHGHDLLRNFLRM
jgi:anthranilate synthase component II